MALLAEDALLLLVDPTTGRLRTVSHVPLLLGGAVLSELALDGRVEVDRDAGWLRGARVHVAGTPPEEPVLASAYATVAEKPRTPQDLVHRLGKGLRERLAEDLVARGVLREERERVLGIIPRRSWRTATAVRDDTVRQRVSAALVLGQPPDPRTRALVALLSGVEVAHKVIDTQRISTREVRKRAKELGDGDWAAEGVRHAVAAANSSAGG